MEQNIQLDILLYSEEKEDWHFKKKTFLTDCIIVASRRVYYSSKLNASPFIITFSLKFVNRNSVLQADIQRANKNVTNILH
jgi:hypothetical protein